MLALEVKPKSIERACRGAWIEYQQGQDAPCDIGVGYVEDRTEEGVRLSSSDGKPFGQRRGEEWEVEHVYYIALKPWGVARASTEEQLCDLPLAATEEWPVEDRIQEIAHSAGKDE